MSSIPLIRDLSFTSLSLRRIGCSFVIFVYFTAQNETRFSSS